jgi:hypothetical protein
LVWLAIRCFDLTPFNFLRERGFGSKSLTNKEIFKMENKTSVRVGKDGRYLIISLPGNQVLHKSLNYFRAILNNVADSPEDSAVE